MTRTASRWRVYLAAAVLGGLVATGCDGDDETARSTEPDRSEVDAVDAGGEADPDSDGDPFTEECTLATQEVKNLLDPPDDYLELRITSTLDWTGCDWWRRDAYSFTLFPGSAEHFTERQLVDLAHAIDADLPDA